MPVAPPTVVASPVSPAGRRYSILDAANGPLDLPGDRLAGVVYEAPWCTSATARDVDCDSPGTLDPGPGTGQVEGVEFIADVGLSCLAPGKPWEVMRADVVAALEASEHVAVEEHLADALAVAPGAVNVGGAVDIVEAVSLLEAHAYTVARYGLTAVLHVPIALWAFAADHSQWDTRGNTAVFRTDLRTVVAPNAGLPDDTVFITGGVTLWRASEPWVSDERASLDKVTNEWKAFAQRDYAAAWECFTAFSTVTVA